MKNTSLRRLRRLATGLAFVAGGLSVSPQLHAALTFKLNSSLAGDVPASTAPWLTATFTDNASGGVDLTLKSSLNVSSEFISQLAFNVKPSINPASIVVVNDGANPNATATVGAQNAQNMNGGGNLTRGFDVILKWATSNGAGRFDGVDSDTYHLTLSGLSASDFNYATVHGVAIAAKVQGIPGGGSGEIYSTISTVPEPSTYFAGVLLLLPFGVSIVRRIRKIEAS